MGVFQTKKYFTEEAYVLAKRAQRKAFRERHRLADIMRKREARGASIRGPYRTVALDEAERPPPEVLAAQQRYLAWIARNAPRATPNQYQLGERVHPNRSLSRTEIEAMRGSTL